MLIFRTRFDCSFKGGNKAVELMEDGRVMEEVDERMVPFVGLGSTGIVGIRRTVGVTGVAAVAGGGDGALNTDGAGV